LGIVKLLCHVEAINFDLTLQIGCVASEVMQHSVKPDDHSEVVPLLPIPNRTVKRLSADDSAGSRVKVGHRQAIKVDARPEMVGHFAFLLWVWGTCFEGDGRASLLWLRIGS
jgi:hypothetical protein